MSKFAKKISVLFVSVFLFSCSKNSSFVLEIPEAAAAPMVVTSAKGQPGRREFSFTAGQKNEIKNFMEKSEAALKIRLNCENLRNKNAPDESRFEFGFLSGDGTPASVVSGFFSDFQGKPLDIIFCFGKDASIPAGFFVKSGEQYAVQAVEIVPAAVGFDYSGGVPLFAFAPNGGTIVPRPSQVDFSGASLVFKSVTTYNSIMPELELKYSERVKVSFGGEQLTVRKSPENRIVIPLSALKSPFSQANLLENDIAVSTMMIRPSSPDLLSFFKDSRFVAKPIKTDPGLIIKWRMSNWRGNDYELFEWDRFPGILIFDTADYSIQDDFFRRLAYFVEKAGYRGRLLSDQELDGKHGYNAHDYKADDLARFFEKAREENFGLNAKEELLKQILLRNGVIKTDSDGKFSAGEGAVISICRKSEEYLRRQFIAHEGWHGIFFTDSEFRNAVASIYYTLDPRTKAYLVRYFQVTPSLNYDTKDEYLMKNEFMAYMLQQPVAQTGPYFVKMASREHSQQLAKNEADYIIQTDAEGFTSAATLLDEYVSQRWNLNGGRVWLIN